VQFQQEVRRVIRFRSQPVVENPLAEAVKRIEQNPAYMQSRLLTRILTALTYQRGEFRPAEIASLDSETLAMVIILMDAYASEKSAREEWVRAVGAAEAAQLGVGG
jgi:hypothetical protein